MTASVTSSAQATSSEDKSKLDRLQEIQARIKTFEMEIEGYQNSKKNKEDLEKRLKKAEQEKQILEENLSSVNSLIQKRNGIIAELSKYGDLGKDPALQEKVEQLKSKTINKNIDNVRKATNKRSHSAGINSKTDYEMKFEGLPILGLIALQVVVTIVYYLISLQTKAIMMGLFTLIVLSIVLALINIIKDKASLHIYDEGAENNLRITYNEIDTTSQNEQNFFVNAAMVNAIKQELLALDSLIKHHLGGKSVEDVNSERTKIEAEYVQLNNESNKMQNSILSSEEYYKKRREVDILKIEQENLEYALGNKLPGN